MNLDMTEMEAAVEGILFAAGECVDIKRICLAVEADRATVEQILQKREDMRKRRSGKKVTPPASGSQRRSP